MVKRICTKCEKDIPVARLIALPTATTCVTCSDTPKVVGNVSWQGKHTPVLEVVTPDKLDTGRRGFHAQLPFNSTSNPRMVASMANVDLSLQAPVEPPPPVEFDVVQGNTPRATCHPDRPKATPAGHCLECAMGWYARRRA